MMNIISRRLNQPTLVLTGSTSKVKNQLEKLFLIQSKSICHKNDIDPEQLALRLPPFPYREKPLTWFHHYCKLEGFHPTLGKFTENTKVVVVEGNVGSGKHELAQKLADDLGMKYFPDVDANQEYRTEDGFDWRDLNVHLHEDVKYPDFKSVLETRNPFHAGYWECYMLRMRTYNYLKAITHMLNTGDGVVLERSPWSGTVFARTGKDMNMLSQNYLDHYWELRSAVATQMHRPHVIIYLDVPIDKCLENAKIKNTHGCGELLDEDYLESIERDYKKYFLPIIETHAEVFTYKLNQPVTEATASDLSDVIVDELSESDMDENFMRVVSRGEKFEDWKMYDSDERWTNLRWDITKDKSDILTPFEFYPYYVDELWPAHSLLFARVHVTQNALLERHKRLNAAKSFKERLLGRRLTYDERDAEDWFITTGYAPDDLQADR